MTDEPTARAALTRRRLLLTAAGVGVAGGAALGAVETELVPGRPWLRRALGRDGADGVVPDVQTGPLTTGAFASAARGRDVGWALSRPPDASGPLPVVVSLHGRGLDHTASFGPDGLALDRFLAAAVGEGAAPFAVASVDGGDRYWHDRADGDRVGTMVLEEFLPLLADQGLDTSRIGFLGWSMGGVGSLRFASVLGPDRVAAVSVMSPALWEEYADTAPGAYDDEADFEDAGVMGRQRELDGIAVRVDCGESDPFYPATRDYVDGFDRRPAGGFELGDHDRGYWRRIAPEALEFLGTALTR